MTVGGTRVPVAPVPRSLTPVRNALVVFPRTRQSLGTRTPTTNRREPGKSCVLGEGDTSRFLVTPVRVGEHPGWCQSLFIFDEHRVVQELWYNSAGLSTNGRRFFASFHCRSNRHRAVLSELEANPAVATVPACYMQTFEYRLFRL